MKQTINSYTLPGWPGIEVEYNKPIELFMDGFIGYDINRDSFKILYLQEAEAISQMKDLVIQNHDKFNAILTYQEDILRECPNAHLMLFGTAWVHGYKFGDKKFAVSNLTGYKEMTDGHILRKNLFYNQDKITVPKNFYISKFGGVENINNNPILEDKKEPLFDSQFHICIENSQQKYCFTEKVMDCFVTKTVPIYWGCPNIGDFFDIRGILVANSLEDIVTTCNALTENTYEEMKEYIENNFKLCQQYITIVDRLEKTINNILNENI